MSEKITNVINLTAKEQILLMYISSVHEGIKSCQFETYGKTCIPKMKIFYIIPSYY